MVVGSLLSCECATAALDIYQRHQDSRKMIGMIYSHLDVDHHMGAAGVIQGVAI